MDKHIFLTVIIPVHNNIEMLELCIMSLNNSAYDYFDIIVVDDSSDIDIKPHLTKDIKYLRLDSQSGPAAARNLGASHAKGDILLFLDSDIMVKPKTIADIVSRFAESPKIAAIFGSYDDEPYDSSFLSQYRNLFHHYIHQVSDSSALTFWAGCGAIKKDIFFKVGGFDEEKYKKPSIEDIELGNRLVNEGYKILLDKNIQVTHLKKWKFLPLLRTEIFHRALPWSKLIIDSGVIPSDLNLKLNERICAALVLLFVAVSLISSLYYICDGNSIKISHVVYLQSVVAGSVLIINRDLYLFFYRKKGLLFAFFSIFMHFLYYLYSIITFVSVWLVIKSVNLYEFILGRNIS